MCRSSWVYLSIILLAVSHCHARDLALVANKSNAASNLTAAEVEKLLKAGIQNWPDGKKIKIFLTDPDSIDNRTILEHGCKLKPEEIKSLASAHKADIQVVGSDDVVLTMVDSNPGAIGIVNVYSINSHVKVLKVDEKLPMEPGYLLHGN
jgi:ABC-type phosphate transport system substrate-binding protein